MNIFSKPPLVIPGDNASIVYWTKKWGVSTKEINAAILETGTLNAFRIENVLRRKNQLKGLFYKSSWFLRKLLQLS
ncbi:MAG TPA: hypothetical protein VGF30_12875 [Bacteroidia bacterium]